MKELAKSEFTVITIKEEVEVGDIVLEEGDRIRVLTEQEMAWDVEVSVRDAKKAYDVLRDRKFIDGVKIVQTDTNAYRVFEEDMVEEVTETFYEFGIEYSMYPIMLDE